MAFCRHNNHPKTYCITLLLLFGLSSFTSAFADDRIQKTGNYFGVHYSDSLDTIESDSDTEETNRGHLKVKYGTYLNDFVSIEGHAGYVTSSTADAGLLTFSGLFRAEKKFEQTSIYGLFGASAVYAYNDDNGNADESSISYGFGVEVFGSEYTAITLEYVSLIDVELDDGSDFSFETLGIGFTYYFSNYESKFNKNGSRVGLIRQ